MVVFGGKTISAISQYMDGKFPDGWVLEVKNEHDGPYYLNLFGKGEGWSTRGIPKFIIAGNENPVCYVITQQEMYRVAVAEIEQAVRPVHGTVTATEVARLTA